MIPIALVVGVFAFVLPRVADYGDVWEALTGLSGGGIAALAITAIVNLATFGPPWMALPGLSFMHALVLSQASTAAASVLPGGDAVGIAISYSMLRRWGFTVEQVTVGSAATTVWNMFANVLFAVAAVGLLAIGGESHALLTTAALIEGHRSRRRRHRALRGGAPGQQRALAQQARRTPLESDRTPAAPRAGHGLEQTGWWPSAARPWTSCGAAGSP